MAFFIQKRNISLAHIPSVLDSSKVQEDMPVYGPGWYFALRALRKHYPDIFFPSWLSMGLKSGGAWAMSSGDGTLVHVVAMPCCLENRHLKGGANSVHRRATWHSLHSAASTEARTSQTSLNKGCWIKSLKEVSLAVSLGDCFTCWQGWRLGSLVQFACSLTSVWFLSRDWYSKLDFELSCRSPCFS